MGVVWKAHDIELGRDVAIKAIHPHLVQNPQVRKRFIDEARIQAKLIHPNICILFDAFDDQTGLYLVMELLTGTSLRDQIEAAQKPMVPKEAVGVTRCIISALQFMHDNQCVHRDIKPSNIMLLKSGGVKLMDFGIARALDDNRSIKTTTGHAVGTPAYMSPEQILGAAVDYRTDYYSLGCVLYEMLTGTLPFAQTSSDFAIQKFHVEQSFPPIDTLTGNYAYLNAVIQRATAKDSTQRYHSAVEFSNALKQDHLEAPPCTASASTIISFISNEHLIRVAYQNREIMMFDQQCETAIAAMNTLDDVSDMLALCKSFSYVWRRRARSVLAKARAIVIPALEKKETFAKASQLLVKIKAAEERIKLSWPVKCFVIVILIIFGIGIVMLIIGAIIANVV